VIELSRSQVDALVGAARRGAPDEVCGVVGLRAGRVARLEPARNAAPDPRVRFAFDEDGYRTVMALEREGLEIGIYHSHPRSPAYPSATDREEMRGTWPDCLQLMVGLAHDATSGPEVKAYRIDRAGEVTGEEVRVVDA
jgi:proteasome lid subunit RPN8/RPN11